MCFNINTVFFLHFRIKDNGSHAESILPIGVRATFFLGGGGADSILPNFKGRESHEAPPWLAPSKKILKI